LTDKTEVHFGFSKNGWLKPARQDGVQAGGGGLAVLAHHVVVAKIYPGRDTTVAPYKLSSPIDYSKGKKHEEKLPLPL